MTQRGEAGAREARAMMEEFAHELRTPLTALTTHLALMDRRLGRVRLGHEGLGPIAELASAASADAARLRASLDALIVRHAPRRVPPAPPVARADAEPSGDAGG